LSVARGAAMTSVSTGVCFLMGEEERLTAKVTELALQRPKEIHRGPQRSTDVHRGPQR
jgi:hypothetical protein